MGVALVRLLGASGTARLTGALAAPGEACLGRDAGLLAGIDALDVPVTADLGTALRDCDVAIDFTVPATTAVHAAACAAHGKALVVGTTGLTDAQYGALGAAARRTAVLYGRNMSLGVAILTELVRQASALTGSGFDIEISEAHHRDKRDAPSGTALQLGEAAAAGRGLALHDVASSGRTGPDSRRQPGSIGFASLRGGGIVGEHTVLFAADEEVLELTHRATDRALFARGALRAAEWLAGKPPGLYALRDVLGLSQTPSLV
jgi:4-hydroxy-tetrahydrodipicolinate reductase